MNNEEHRHDSVSPSCPLSSSDVTHCLQVLLAERGGAALCHPAVSLQESDKFYDLWQTKLNSQRERERERQSFHCCRRKLCSLVFPSTAARYLEESPDRALFRTTGVSSAGTGTSGTPESTLDSPSDTPSFSTFSSPSEPWQENRREA